MPYIGETRIFAFDYAPPGWLPCQGQMLAIADYDALFTLIGVNYGGDGADTFALPAAAGPESEGTPLNVCIALFGDFPQQG